MAQMIRKRVYLAPHQEVLLKGLARERGITEAEIIREAVEHFAGWASFRPDRKAEARAGVH